MTTSFVSGSVLHVLRLARGSISLFDQLVLEEALLRADDRNWVIVRGGVGPCIVMGISGDLTSLVDVDAALAARMPVVRRFTGGGTVVADEGTAFVSFICERGAARGAPPFPRELMAWSAALYSLVFKALAPHAPPFALRDHDYALGDRKVGGNAQALSRERFVHHTSFLWDADAARHSLLRLPKKRPAWRADRPHSAFVGRLRDHGVATVECLGEAVIERLRLEAAEGGATLVETTLEEAQEALPKNLRLSNTWVMV